MRRLEHTQRLIATVIALGWAAGALLGTFRDPDPWGHNPAVIVFRLGFCGLILFTLLKRVTGKRADPIVWALFALLCVDGISRSRSALGFVVSLLLVAFCFVGYGIERRLQRRLSNPALNPTGLRPAG